MSNTQFNEVRRCFMGLTVPGKSKKNMKLNSKTRHVISMVINQYYLGVKKQAQRRSRFLHQC